MFTRFPFIVPGFPPLFAKFPRDIRGRQDPRSEGLVPVMLRHLQVHPRVVVICVAALGDCQPSICQDR